MKLSRCAPLASFAALVLLALTVVAAGSAPARAEAPRPRNVTIPIGPDRYDAALGGGPPSRLIYLNDCKPNGCTISFGQTESSINNRSTIIHRPQITIPAWDQGDALWAEVMACVRMTYAPFNIEITDVDPGNQPHWENVVAGLALDVLGADYPDVDLIGGVSPVAQGCAVVPNSITYTFADASFNRGDVNQLCWTVAQETAHSFGLEHELLASDPMTYLPGSYPKRFQDTTACVGEAACCDSDSPDARACRCRTEQNSFREIVDMFGRSAPSPPVVTITAPAAGAEVPPGFVVRADYADDHGIDRVELLIDGEVSDEISNPPFVFNAPSTIAEGDHEVTVRAYDGLGTPGAASIAVVVAVVQTCDIPGDCDGIQTCVEGRCVDGPGAPGGLGEPCTESTECSSGICADDGVERHCTEVCDPAASGCPGGFDCLVNGDRGLCWPAGDDGGGEGGGCSSSSSPVAPLGAGLVLAALVIRRRRRV